MLLPPDRRRTLTHRHPRRGNKFKTLLARYVDSSVTGGRASPTCRQGPVWIACEGLFLRHQRAICMRALLQSLTDPWNRAASVCSARWSRPGARPRRRRGPSMLVDPDGGQVGTLGGGCVEAEVKQKAIRRLGRDGAELHSFVLDHDYAWADGLICGGKMVIARRVRRGARAAWPTSGPIARCSTRARASPRPSSSTRRGAGGLGARRPVPLRATRGCRRRAGRRRRRPTGSPARVAPLDDRPRPAESRRRGLPADPAAGPARHRRRGARRARRSPSWRRRPISTSGSSTTAASTPTPSGSRPPSGSSSGRSTRSCRRWRSRRRPTP